MISNKALNIHGQVHNANKIWKHSELLCSCLFVCSKKVITHRVVDVVKALAGWEGVVGIDMFKSTNGQEHSNRRAKSKKRLRVESQLWVINGYLWREGGSETCVLLNLLKIVLFKHSSCSKKMRLFRRMEIC